MEKLLTLILGYLIILYLVIYFSKKLNFYEKPEKRKLHKYNTINTSGVALYIFLAIIVIKNEFSYHLEEIIVTGGLVLIYGFVDDRIKLSPGVKLILLLIPSLYLIFNGFLLTDLGSYEYIGLINLNKFSFIFTILACGLLINSYNYTDGIDGLLSAQVIISLIYIMLISPDEKEINLLQIMCIPLVINLIFNFFSSNSKYKVFLGNGGSLFLGFFMSFTMIYLYKFNKIHPAYIIWISWLPVYDFLFVSLLRIIKKKNFYLPDKNHLHHIIIKKTKNSHLKATFFISIINILLLYIGFLVTKNLGEIYSLFLFIILCFLYMYVRFKTLKSRGGAVW